MTQSVNAAVASTRFGLGARPGDLEAIEVIGPQAWIDGQIDGIALADALAALPDAASGIVAARDVRASDDPPEAVRRLARDRFAREQGIHLAHAVASDTPVHERLVAFWSNHLTVSILRRQVLPLAGPFEREVVRPHVAGRFSDLLLASTRHPAMLAYLDNLRSVGPMSIAGTRRDIGLNENLAREILELHTLGVDGGYGQGDVEGLARLLTGWSVDPDSGHFSFRGARHEPGDHVLLGRTYTGNGEADGVAALEALARHPSTARHLATKLVRHFVADVPPPEAVDLVAAAFVDSDGHLPTVHRAVFALPQAWDPPLSKLKTPWDLVMSTTRALGGSAPGIRLLGALRGLGQLPYQAPSPQGWPDTAEAWLGPEALLGRLDYVARAANAVRGQDGATLAAQVLGPVLTRSTAAAVASAGSDSLAVFLASPEFQRR